MNYFALISNAAEGEIGVLRLDGSDGTLRAVTTVKADAMVMPMALAADGKQLFAATRGEQPSFIAYDIQDETTDEGQHPGVRVIETSRTPIDSSHAYLAVDHHTRYLFGASYGGDHLGIYALGCASPVQVIQGIKKAHCVVLSGDDRFVYVTSLAQDRIVIFSLRSDNSDGHDVPLREVDSVSMPAGFGPRHMRLSPSGRHLYVLSEFDATVAVLRRDAETGALQWCSRAERPPSLAHLIDGAPRPMPNEGKQPDPAVLATQIWAADCQLHPSGRWFFATERTSSQLIVYGISADGEQIDYRHSVATAAQPRGIKIDPSGRFLLACGEKSTQVIAYRIDALTGVLSETGIAEGGHGANWIEIVPLAAP